MELRDIIATKILQKFFAERNKIVTLDDKYNLPEVMVSEQGTKFTYTWYAN